MDTSPVCRLLCGTGTFFTRARERASKPDMATLGAKVFSGIRLKICLSTSVRISLNGQLTSVMPVP
jgi:hypothetical protein